MTWYSILPEQLIGFEAWVIRFFVILGMITIVPWAFLILYDILLYIWRAGTYRIRVIGGRARGRRRPVVPSFTERPSGRRRAFSMTGTEYDYHRYNNEDVISRNIKRPTGRNTSMETKED